MHTLNGLNIFMNVLKVNMKIWTCWFAWIFFFFFWIKWMANYFQGSPQTTYGKSCHWFLLNIHLMNPSEVYVLLIFVISVTIIKLEIWFSLFKHACKPQCFFPLVLKSGKFYNNKIITIALADVYNN